MENQDTSDFLRKMEELGLLEDNHFLFKMDVVGLYPMDGNGRANVVRGERCPRCQVCGKVVRVRGVVPDVWCVGCLSGALPFVGLTSGGEFGGHCGNLRKGWDQGRRILVALGLTLMTKR